MKIKNKKIIVGLGIAVALAITGTVLGLNGFFGGGATIPSDTMTRGLVGYWNFDEGNGTTTNDGSGSNPANTGYFALATTSPAWVQGKVGSGLNFDGTDDYVNAGSGASLNITDEITGEAWIYPRSVSGTWGGTIIGKNGAYRNLLNIGEGNLWAILTQGVTDYHYNSLKPLVLNTWQHVAITFSYSANEVKFYYNGTLVKTLSANNAKINTSSDAVTIGSFVGAYEFFNGLIDDVRIYNRALSAEEIRYHYNRGGPVGYWKFDEGNGTTTFDISGNGNNGTMTNMSTTTSWVSGKYGNALSFDGVNDYVSTPITSAAYTAATQEAWIKSNIGNWQGRIVTKGGGRFSLQKYYNNTLLFSLNTAGGNIGTNFTASLQDNVWTHVAATYDGSTAKLYINGELKKSLGGVSGAIEDIGDNLSIGADSSGGVAFNGLIDDVRVYNYARTPDEIKLDYNAGFAALFGPQTDCDRDPGSCMTKGLAGYWSMDEGRGTTTADISGNNNTGVFATAASSPAWTNGKVGGALNFDGTNDYIQIANSASLNPTTAITIETWVKVNDFPSGTNNEIMRQDSGSNRKLFSFQSTGSTLHFGLNIGGSYGELAYDVASTTWLNKWNHIVANYDGSNKRIYVNGVQVAIAAATGAIAAETAAMCIGTQCPTTEPLNAIIDEFRIYNRALSAEEIRYHYNRGGPVGYWKFDEGSGLTAYDSSGQGNTGTLQNNMATTSWVSGKYGSALSFDGVNDYVDVGNKITASNLSGLTINAWVKRNAVAPAGEDHIISNWTGTYHFGTGANKFNIFLYNTTPAQGTVTGTTVITNGVWYHVVATYDGSKIRIYVNGVQENSANFSGDLRSSGVTSKIGAGGSYPEAWSTYLFNGLIDDVRIYNYARTPEQILIDYNAGFAASFGPQTDCDRDPGSCMTKGLAGYWNMDEGRGTTTADGSNNANTGVFATAASSPAWANGKSGSGLSFDGVDDYISVAHNSILSPPAEITTEVWFKPLVDLAIGTDRTLWDKRTGAVNQLRYYGASGQLIFTMNSTWVVRMPAKTYLAGQWYHIVATAISGTTQNYFYENGVETGISRTAVTFVSATGNLLIGTELVGSGNINAIIDEVRIYNRALSAEEVRYHYNRGGPVGYWKFDEGNGTTTFDYSGNNNTGYFASTSTSPAWVQGKYGSALSFDGVDDYILSANSEADLTTFTAEAWIKHDNIPSAGTKEIISHGASPTDNGWSFEIPGDYNILRLTFHGVGNYDSPLNILTNGVWQYVAVTLQGTTATFYLNGKQVGTAKTGTISTATHKYSIGATPGGTSFFSGLIDDVRVYNYARTPEQILQDYNMGKSIQFK